MVHALLLDMDMGMNGAVRERWRECAVYVSEMQVS